MLANSEKIQDNLIQIFGTRLEEYVDYEVSLPLYLMAERWFRTVRISGISFILVGVDMTGRFNVNSLLRQREKYAEAFSKEVSFAFSSLTFFQRRSLIENEIPFIAENEQIYLPFIGAVFGRSSKISYAFAGDAFTPITQMVLLLLIYDSRGVALSKSQIANNLGVSAMSITRATSVLSEMGLVREEKRGKETIVSLILNKLETYQKARLHMINPVQKVVYIERKEFEPGIKAGEYSLSVRSDFGYPSYTEYAVFARDEATRSLRAIDPGMATTYGLIKIQTWKYDPALFALHDQVDPISLICSFQGEDDERIHKCLQQVEKEIDGWRIMRN